MLACVLILFVCVRASAVEPATYSLAVYRDKTSACITGQIAGLLTGFEFVSGKDGRPLAPLPQEWFSLLRGPYGGGLTYDGAGESRMLAAGIGSDDDLHIDFFNQLIIGEAGGTPTYGQLRDAWVEHNVSDWGGGGKAMQLMKRKNYLPPLTGLLEYGNTFHWCTEPYIENETLGCCAPGLTQSAYALADRFASVTGDFESVDWARFWAVAYAAAYTARDAETVLDTASGALLAGSWPRRVFDTCVTLRHSGASWEEAVRTVEGIRRGIDGCDNVQCSADVNNSFAVLAMLYGECNWLESVRLASVCGYDADCTAACVGGCVGILRGMSGLPRQVLDEVWRDGRGIYVNDTLFTPHIGNDYPETQTLREICDAYERNMLRVVAQAGGCADATRVWLPEETPVARQGSQSANADFEYGTLACWDPYGDGSVACVDEAFHSGDFSARVKSGATISGVRRELTGLTAGQWYRLSVYARTTFQGTAQIRVESGSSSATQSVRSADKGWVLREVCFRTEHDTATVYLENDSASDNRIYTVYFDDLRMERLQAMDQTPLTITASSDTIFLGGVEASGEKALWLTYRNIGNRLVNTELSDRGEVLCAVPFTPTGESNTLWLPVTVDEDTSFCLTGLGKNVTLLSASLSELPLVRIRE